MFTYKNLPKPPLSEGSLNAFIDKVIIPAVQGSDVSLTGFAGSGKTAYLKYITQNLAPLELENPDLLFTFFDLETYSDDSTAFYAEAIQYIYSFNTHAVTQEDTEKLTRLSMQNLSGIDLATALLTYFTFSRNKKIVVIIDNFHECVISKYAHVLTQLIQTIKKLNPMNISFIFLNTFELSKEELLQLGKVGEMFSLNRLWHSAEEFNEENFELQLHNLRSNNKAPLSKTLTRKVFAWSKGDPTVSKIFLKKVITDSAFAKEIESLRLSEYKEAYNLMTEILKQRYLRICRYLKDESLLYLLGETEKPTEYLTQTGIVEKDAKDQFNLLNNFFKFFIEGNRASIESLLYPRYLISIKENEDTNEALSSGKDYYNDTLLKQKLTAQELLVYQKLLVQRGKTVSKDVIAETMWGNEWEQRYSDWAIDKLISTLRAKIKEFAPVYTLKTLRGEGCVLV